MLVNGAVFELAAGNDDVLPEIQGGLVYNIGQAITDLRFPIPRIRYCTLI